MSEQTSRLSLPLIAANQAQKHVPVNEALVRLDALVQLSVLDRTLSDPPSSPENGDRHIVGAAAAGDWTGHDDDIASYDAGWIFTEPQEGWRAWDAAAQELVVFTDGAWTVFSSGAGGFGGGELQNVELLGIDSEADETNPFSAKLNNALWTSKEIAEGGTGDLRYVLNKEASANVLSLLFQSAYGGRAEFGLIGDDDFLFKVSADGTTWRDALRIDRTTGRPSFPQGGVRQVLAANRTYYVRTDGSNSNDGLANTSGGAFLTLQKALDVVATIDFNGFTVTIQIADGTYAAGGTIPVCVGQKVTSNLLISGNTGTPGNVIIQAPIVADTPGARARVQGFETSAGSVGLAAQAPGAHIDFGTVRFGANTSWHMLASSGGYITSFANYSIVGGTGQHVHSTVNAIVQINGRTITLSGTPAFSTQFAQADAGGVLRIYSNTYSGSATGKRYNAEKNGIIETFGAGATALPGNSSGTTATGGIYA